MDDEEIELCMRRKRAITDRLQWIADEEVRGARLKTGAADGRFEPERQRLIDENEKINEKLDSHYKAVTQTKKEPRPPE